MEVPPGVRGVRARGESGENGESAPGMAERGDGGEKHIASEF